MKSLSLIISILLVSTLSSTSLYALTFKVGPKAGVSVSESELMQALRAGKGSVKGAKIVVKAGANVPGSMKQKWMANQLSGAEAPTEGSASDEVVFVESF